jgi:Na+/glutamate symporter
MAREADPLHKSLVRINARAWGIATGLILGLGLFVATLVLVLRGGPDVGAHLGRLSYVLPGYDVSLGGAFIGLVYGFVIGYAFGRLIGPRRALAAESAPGESQLHVRLNGRAWGLTTAVLLGLGLFVATNLLLLRGGQNVGELLGHLRLYLPGYEMSFRGSLFGLLWACTLGWLLGRLIAWVYNRTVTRAEASEAARESRARAAGL